MLIEVAWYVALPDREKGGLCAGAERLCDVGKGGLLGVAYLHATDPEETTFRRSLSHFMTDATQPSFEGRGVVGRLGGKDCRNLSQIIESVEPRRLA